MSVPVPCMGNWLIPEILVIYVSQSSNLPHEDTPGLARITDRRADEEKVTYSNPAGMLDHIFIISSNSA